MAAAFDGRFASDTGSFFSRKLNRHASTSSERKAVENIINIIAPLVKFEESGYGCEDSGDYYSARSLYEQAKKEKSRAYKLKLRDIDFSVYMWRTNGVRLADYAQHARRALNVDLSIPIIISPIGGIMDGFHRIMGALLKGQDFVMAYRLKELPPANIHPDPDEEDK